MTIEELQVLITGETKQLRQALDQVKKQLERTDRDVDKITTSINRAFKKISAALSALGITAFIRSATKEAMAFESALQQIQRIMGDNAAEFERWANKQSAAFGVARSEIIQYGAIFGNLISSFTQDAEETMRRTQDLLHAAAVVSNATGRTMEDVMERIRSGILGNTEAIEDLGINVNVAMIESTRAFREFAGNRSWQQLDFQTQQTIRYFAILEQAAARYGTELADNTAARQAAFVAQLKNARLELGRAFLPIYNVILPALTQMASALANATRFLSAFTQALFGYKAERQAAQTQAQAEAVSNLGDSLEQAGKKAKGAVAGFDQLNLLSKDSGAGAGTIPGLPTAGDLEKAKNRISEISEEFEGMVERIRSAFQKLAERDDVRRLIEAYDRFRNALSELGKAIQEFMQNPNVKEFGKWIGNTWIKEAVERLTEALNGLYEILYLVRLELELLNNILSGDFSGALRTAGDIITRVNWNTFLDFVRFLVDPLGYIAREVGKKFLDWLADVEKKIPIWGTFRSRVEEVWNSLTSMNWNEVRDLIVGSWNSLVTSTREKWNDIKSAVSERWNELWSRVNWNDIKNSIIQSWDNLRTETGRKWDDFKLFLSEKWQAIKDYTKWDSIKNTILREWENLRTGTSEKWEALKTSVTEKWNAIANIDFSKVSTAIETAWNNIAASTERIWKNIANAVIEAINSVIDKINGFISSVNSALNRDIGGGTLFSGTPFEISIPKVSLGLGRIPTIPKIPPLETGTNYVPRDMLAYLHEGEAVVPKEYNPAVGGSVTSDQFRTMENLLRAMLQELRNFKTIQAVISRTEVGRAAIDIIREEQRRTGRLPFPV